jgi:HK97 family phage major capsid protein
VFHLTTCVPEEPTIWPMIVDARSPADLTNTAGALVLPALHNENPTLYSRPVLVSPELPAAAANARSVVVGDFSVGYAVRRVRGLSTV